MRINLELFGMTAANLVLEHLGHDNVTSPSDFEGKGKRDSDGLGG